MDTSAKSTILSQNEIEALAMYCLTQQDLTSLSSEELVEKYLIARKEIKTAIKTESKLKKWF